jgi:predicted naringenin-chalcone synthase
MVHILSLATAVPDYCFEQEAISDRMIRGLQLSESRASELQRVYRQSAIHTRHSVLPNFDTLFMQPTARERNAIYKEQAPKLALKAARKALESRQGDIEAISHVISVSCTGMIAPGIEYYLIRDLGLRPSVGRFGINFMGCFGAFNALSLAVALTKENPAHRVLIVCTELCSLHAQTDLSTDTLLANALFADGAAACIVGSAHDEKPLATIVNRSSLVLENSDHTMAWEVAESGYFMKLSMRVPVLIKNNIASFIKSLVGSRCTFEECHWAIHPGGKTILQAIEKECSLVPAQTTSSWQVLHKYGNMSSATFLFVLEQALQDPWQWIVGTGFGPGLSIEGILIRHSHDMAKAF